MPSSSPSSLDAPRRAVGYGLTALLIAAGTAFLVYRYVSELENQLVFAARSTEGTAVVVARADLTPGTILSAELLAMAPVIDSMPSDELFNDPNALVGTTVTELILRGEPIRPQRISLGEAELRIDQVVDPVSRAVSIVLTDEEALAGLLRPGHYVDVLVTIARNLPDGTVDWVTEEVMQGVRVLAVDDEVATSRVGVHKRNDDSEGGVRGARGAVRVTLEVEPTEAKGLVHANQRGAIHLALRPAENLEMTDYGSAIVTSSLVGLPEDLESAQRSRLARKREITDRTTRAQETMQSIVQIRGNRRTVEAVPQEGSAP